MELVNSECAFKVCNLTYLENFSGGDKDFIRQMIELFFKQVAEELNNIRQQAIKMDLQEVMKTAHKLKSSVSLLGAERMALLLKQIEQLAAVEEGNDTILQLHTELNVLNEEAVRELKAYLISV